MTTDQFKYYRLFPTANISHPVDTNKMQVKTVTNMRMK